MTRKKFAHKLLGGNVLRHASSGASLLTGTVLALSVAAIPPAQANESEARLATLEHEIARMQHQHDIQMRALQAELRRLKHELTARDRQVDHVQQARVAPSGNQNQEPPTRAPLAGNRERAFNGPRDGLLQSNVPSSLTTSQPGPHAPGSVGQQQAATVGAANTTFRLGNIGVTFGGFIEIAGIYRSRNETSDIVSNFNTSIPYPQSPTYHENEFRKSARQSRFSVLMQGNPSNHETASVFGEMDFLAAAPTANSVELHGYSPRLRQAYGAYDNDEWGFHLLGGQSWSLLNSEPRGHHSPPGEHPPHHRRRPRTGLYLDPPAAVARHS